MSKLESILKEYNSLYLIDLSWCLYRNYYAFNHFEVDVDGIKVKTGHYYGMFKTITYILDEDPDACIIICQDGIPVERNKLLSDEGIEYKADRPEREYEFYNDTNKIKAMLCYIPNVYWAYNEDKESDDEMYALAKQAESMFDGEILIHSGDNDLLQAIDDRISVIRERHDGRYKRITDDDLRLNARYSDKFHGVDAAHIINFRAIVGDSSDKIPGIPRFPRDVAYNIAMNEDWKPETDKEIKWQKIYEENKNIIDRNHKLMELRSDYEVNLSKPVVNIDKLISLLDRLKLKSVKIWMENNAIL